MSVTICLIGNDGSGKTTQAKIILKHLLSKNIPAEYIHFDHFVLKIPKFASKKGILSPKDKKDQSIALMKTLKKINLFSYIFPVIIYVDFLLFYLLKIKLSRKVIILDRYIYDKVVKFVDLGVFSPFLVNPIINFYPRPKYTFFFNINPLISYKRKGELTEKMLTKRGKMLRKIARDLNAVEINANKDIKTVTEQILKNLKPYA